jgi:hypothetical protein
MLSENEIGETFLSFRIEGFKTGGLQPNPDIPKKPKPIK